MYLFRSLKEKFQNFIAAQKLKKNYKRNKAGIAKEDSTKNVVFSIYTVLFLIQCFICIYPLVWCLMNSVKDVIEYTIAPNDFPSVWHWEYYLEIPSEIIVRGNNFWMMTWNSIWFAFGTQFLNILASILVAYPLARYNFPFRGFFYGIIIFRIIIPIIGTGSTGYKLQRALGMINNPPRYVIGAFQDFDMQALIMYGYMKAVDRGYSEAAFIDGAGPLTTLFKVVLPQAFPCVIALYVSAVMGQWNNYQAFQISLPNYPNLALGVYELQEKAQQKEYLFLGMVLISSLVPLGLFTAAQKTMLTNMSVGGLKG
jgi:ABC-type glycerol-3-phosphate transport system permease component